MVSASQGSDHNGLQTVKYICKIFSEHWHKAKELGLKQEILKV